MFASVVLLRDRGVRLDFPNNGTAESYPRGVVKKGILDLGVPLGERGKGLMLRDSMSTPGMGVKCMLYNPQLTYVGDRELLFRGFELIKESGAAVMQEWRVFLV